MPAMKNVKASVQKTYQQTYDSHRKLLRFEVRGAVNKFCSGPIPIEHHRTGEVRLILASGNLC